MKSLPYLSLLGAFVLSSSGCARWHSASSESILMLDSPAFTRATGIDHLCVLPTPVPQVSVAVRQSGRYRCQLWSCRNLREPVCLSDSGYVEVTAPAQLRAVADHEHLGSQSDYVVEIQYRSDGGEASRLVQLVAAWW